MSLKSGTRSLVRNAYKRAVRARERRVDRRLGIETELGESLEPQFEGDVGYEPARFDALAEIFSRYPPAADDGFVDVGCGRGRVLCVAATMAMRRCLGVEFRKDLAEAAEANAASMIGRRTTIEVQNQDATEVDYDGFSYLFLFNPFDAPIMERFLETLRSSVERRPRAIRIVYLYPVHGDLLERQSWLARQATFTVPYRLRYRMDVSVFASR